MNRSRLLGVVRLILSLAVASWAINWVLSKSGANLEHEIRNCNWSWILAALGFTAAGTVLSSYRWASLLALQQVVISQWAAFRLTMIGVFFNLFGLGGVGGDVFKAVYVRQHAGSRTPEAVLSILVDRILGLLGLFTVALATFPFCWNDLMHGSSLIQSLVGFVILLSLVGGGGVTLVLTRDRWLPAASKEWIKSLSRYLPPKVAVIAGKLIRSLDLYRDQVPQLIKALMISSAIHTLATMSVVCIGKAFHIDDVPLRFYFLGVQVANTISVVPITPGGLGSRDAVLRALLLAGGGDARCSLIPPVFSCILVLWSVVGGIFFVTERGGMRIPVDSEKEEHLVESLESNPVDFAGPAGHSADGMLGASGPPPNVD